MSDERERGMKVRREVLGDDHVDRAIERTTPFTADFQDLITRYAWGEIWSRPGLDRRTRSAITLTALVALGHHEELELHVRAALRNGLTEDEIKEVLLQSAIYCGVPAANSAFAIAQRVLDEAASGVSRAGRDLGGADAGRTVRRRAVGHPARRSRGDSRSRRRSSGPGWRPARSRTSGSGARTRPARTTETSLGWRRCSPACPSRWPGVTVEPALRLGALRGRRRLPRDRRAETATCSSRAESSRCRGRRSSPPSPTSRSRAATERSTTPCSAGGSRTRGSRRCSRSSRWGRPARTSPSAGESRARTRTPLRRVTAALGGGPGGGPIRERAGACRRPRARRASAARHGCREARLAEAGVPGERHGHRGKRQRDQRRRRGTRDRLRGEGARAWSGAARRLRRQRRRRRRSARDGNRPGSRRPQAARPRRGRGRGPRSRRAERGVRLPERRGDPRARARPCEGERQRRCDRARPSARHERRPARRLAAPRASPPRRPLRARDALRRRRAGPGGAVRAAGG